MPLTDQDLAGQALWPTRERVSDLLTLASEHADGPAMAQMGRMTDALAAVDELAGLPSWRFPQEGVALSNLDAGLKQLEVALQGFVDSPTAGATLTGLLAAHIQAIAQNLVACPTPTNASTHTKGMAAAATEYRKLVDHAMDSLRADLAQAQESVVASEQAHKDSVATATAALEDVKAAIAQAKVDVTAQATRLSAAITEQGTAFSSLNISWQNQVNASIATSEQSAETSLTETEKAGVDQRATNQATAEKHLKSLGVLEKQARDMVDVTARNTISTEYGQYARRQGWVATAWSISSVAVAILGFIYVTSLLRNFDGVSPAEAIFKSTASAAILGAAGFMGRVSAGHRREARDAKRTQLDLNALEPFLVNLTPDHAESLRKDIAWQIFHRPLANLRRYLPFAQRPDESVQPESDDA